MTALPCATALNSKAYWALPELVANDNDHGVLEHAGAFVWGPSREKNTTSCECAMTCITFPAPSPAIAETGSTRKIEAARAQRTLFHIYPPENY
ncbi:hypothetical protein [Xanthomonas sacchari]|uniref:hypothetical protein n=1 Tax=Xanthomonas sacchari TaxID=56458 RepID=UPI002257B7A9|nr:hypothetical protein [Xanthomonas sacchari]